MQINKTLYALNKDGKTIQEWKVFVQDNIITVEYGQQNGKKQTKDTVCEGKNIGRSNETTPHEQALLEAESKYNKQLRLGYKESPDELFSTENYSPMLAQDASKKPHLIKYPCDCQVKADGNRLLITKDQQGKPIFNTRGNKTFPLSQATVKYELEKLMAESGFDMLDGELYIHGLSLQKLGSLAKKYRTHDDISAEIDKDYWSDYKRWQKALADGNSEWKNWSKDILPVSTEPYKDNDRYSGYCSDDLEFHIFDIPSDKPWSERKKELEKLKEIAKDYPHISVLDSYTANSEEEVIAFIGEFMEAGYEGVIIRNLNGHYEFGQRSNDLLKWKLFKDTEAKVVDVEIDKNNEGVLHCILQNGITFKCKMRGSHAYRSFENMKKLIGKFITVRYQQETDDGVPQFPSGVAERNVNPDTWEPLE